MKKFVVCAAAALCAATSHLEAQVGIISAPLLESQAAIQIGHMVTQIQQGIESATNAYNQFQNMLRAEERALQNLKGITKVGNYKEFMGWYNRQISLEKQAAAKQSNLGVSVGGKKYKLTEIDQMMNAVGEELDSFIDFDQEFTEAEKQKIWREMGLSPSNYVYLKAWSDYEKPLLDKILSNPDVIDEQNKLAQETNTEIVENAMGEEVGEKGVLQALLQLTFDTNNVLRQASLDAAEARKQEAARKKQETMAAQSAPLTDDTGYTRDEFGSLTEEE
ncbi:MAG: hypothetical protein MdMp014T_0195 [Treponematales bacterium]